MTWEHVGLVMIAWGLLDVLCFVLLAKPVRYDENNLRIEEDE